MKNNINENARTTLNHFKQEIASELGIESFVDKGLSPSNLKSDTRAKIEEAYTQLGRS